MIVLAIATMLFKTGETLLDDSSWARPDLTRSERGFVKDTRAEIDKECAIADDAECRSRFDKMLMDAINGRRINAAVMQWSRVADNVSYTCTSPILSDRLTCYSDLRKLNYEAAMTRAGFKRLGVSSAGYQKISTGMIMRDVEFILGRGEEQAYSGGSGYSASVYKWQRRGAIITISFSGFEVSGRAQFGLR